MFFVPAFKAFFCVKLTSEQCGEEVLQVTLNRLESDVKADWPFGDERPKPVLGIKKVVLSNSRVRIVVQEFEVATHCHGAGFESLGPSREFCIYLTWEDCLNRKPLEWIDEVTG